jgi:hypothetical protein
MSFNDRTKSEKYLLFINSVLDEMALATSSSKAFLYRWWAGNPVLLTEFLRPKIKNQ